MTWPSKERYTALRTIDAHTAGEPLRLIVEGMPPIPGATIAEKRAYARENLDWIRRALMLEPRGHADMYGCILTEPVTPDGDHGVLFLHNEGYSTMCGHGIIALTTILLETGMASPSGPEHTFRFDTPAGRVTATGHLEEGVVTRVSFLNVPSFVLGHDLHVELRDAYTAEYDLAFGGAFYAIVDAEQLELDLTTDNAERLIEWGRAIKQAVSAAVEIAHPVDPSLSFLYGVIFTGPAHEEGRHSRNVCIFADGELDRSPTGTGVSARAAVLAARGALEEGNAITIESILGTTMGVEIAAHTTVGDFNAVIPRVSGRAYITGQSEFLIDPADPLGKGFLIR